MRKKIARRDEREKNRIEKKSDKKRKITKARRGKGKLLITQCKEMEERKRGKCKENVKWKYKRREKMQKRLV